MVKTEKHLLREARRFDAQALAEIYDLYSPRLYRYAARRLGTSQQAEDCVAETFSRFLHALQAGGGPKEHIQAYLYRVAHNWITDQYRREPPPPLQLDHNLQADEYNNPPQLVARRLNQERVRSALKLLTSDQQQVVMLKFLEGWSNKEIANAMNKTEGAIKSLQHRGLAALQRILIEPKKEECND